MTQLASDRDASYPDGIFEVATTGVATTDPLLGAQVGRYVVDRKLGQGGMAVVYAARDPSLGRWVALKLVAPAGKHHTELEARLLREARALARLDHPHVVRVYDVGVAPHGVFVAMQLADGGTVEELLETDPPDSAIVALFTAVARGLAAVHAAGVIHRDIKPSNLLVGRAGQVFVGDFGLARFEGDVADPTDAFAIASGSVTRDGRNPGTPAFMSPEQYRGQTATMQSDQFSFCVSFWQALHDEHPFGIDRARKLEAMTADFIRPPARAPEVPPGVVEVLRRGLRNDPAARWPSMTALLDALSRTSR